MPHFICGGVCTKPSGDDGSFVVRLHKKRQSDHEWATAFFLSVFLAVKVSIPLEAEDGRTPRIIHAPVLSLRVTVVLIDVLTGERFLFIVILTFLLIF